MKRDVSCKPIQAYFTWAAKKHIPLETLTRGVSYSLAHLQNTHERVEWDTFCRITENLRGCLSEAELEDLAFESAKAGPVTSWLSTIAKLLYSCGDYYSWINSRGGPANQMFMCLTPTMTRTSGSQFTFTLQLNPGCRELREIFLLTKAGLRAVPTLFGLEPAIVIMRDEGRAAVYDVVHQEGGGVLSWLRRIVEWPFAARRVARELEEANDVLYQRYAQLEEAKAKIQYQARQLSAAFSISNLIRSNLDLEATLEAVATALVEEAHFVAAKVSVDMAIGVEQINRTQTKGVAHEGQDPILRPLEARGQKLGELAVWPGNGLVLAEVEELMTQVVPSIAMEISDAVSFTLLSRYRERESLMQHEFSRRQMESQERERKRLAGELHDGLAQDLLVASNRLQQFLEDAKEPHDELKQVATLLQGSIDSVREISANLHPHHLDRLGFCAAIEAMTEKLSRTSGLVIDTSCEVIDCVLPKDTELHLYRIIQEALTNVVRHASARHVGIVVRKNFGVVEILLRDDGKGFDVAHPSGDNGAGDVRHGFGLSSMAERGRIFGGVVKVESSPGNGTVVHVIVPCTQ